MSPDIHRTDVSHDTDCQRVSGFCRNRLCCDGGEPRSIKIGARIICAPANLVANIAARKRACASRQGSEQ